MQHDGINLAVIKYMIARGIPQQDIALGFQPPFYWDYSIYATV